jgi:hypothetical protein
MAINFPSPTTLNQEFSAGDRTWKWNGVYWEAITTTVGYTGSGGGTSFEFDNDPPAEPIPGDRWYDSTLGFEFVWVADQDSGQWVEITTSGMGYTGSAGASVVNIGTTIQRPLSAANGTIYLNTTTSTNYLQVYYNGNWFNITALTQSLS